MSDRSQAGCPGGAQPGAHGTGQFRYSCHVISAVVLAAGLSTRMGGRSKALLPLGDDGTFVARVVRTLLAAGIPDVVVVVGHQAGLVEQVLRSSGLHARTVLNPTHEAGQLSSLRVGLEAADLHGVEAIVLALVDAPLFSPTTVRALVSRFRDVAAPVVRPVRGGEHGHPVLIGRQLFDAIRSADPARGAKPVIREHASPAGDVPVDDEGAFLDVDTPDDYARVLAGWRGSGPV